MALSKRRARRKLEFLEEGEQVDAADVVQLVAPELGVSEVYLSDRALHFVPKSGIHLGDRVRVLPPPAVPGTRVTMRFDDLAQGWRSEDSFEFHTSGGYRCGFSALRRFDSTFEAKLEERLEHWAAGA